MKITKMLVAAAVAMGALASVGATTPASAVQVAGCNGEATKKVSLWYNSDDWETALAGIDKTVDLSAAAFYYYCPNGDDPNKIKVKAVEYCIKPVNGANSLQRVRFFGHQHMDGTTGPLGLGAVVTPDGTAKVCELSDLPSDQEIWMRLSKSPIWTTQHRLNLSNQTDPNWVQWESTNGIEKAFSPDFDRNVDFSGMRVGTGMKAIPRWPSDV